MQTHPEDGDRLNGVFYLRTQQVQSHARGASTMSELITAVMFVRDANSIMVFPPFILLLLCDMRSLDRSTYTVVIYIPTKLNYILPTVVFNRVRWIFSVGYALRIMSYLAHDPVHECQTISYNLKSVLSYLKNFGFDSEFCLHFG